MSNPIGTEFKLQAIRIAFAVGGVVAIIYIQRKLSGPDVFSHAHARTALAIKRFAQIRADYWQEVADNAASSYQRSRII